MPQPLVFARDKNSLANRTEATFLIGNGNRHTEITSPLTRTLNTTILQLFLRVQKRAIYTWMAHVECTETLDWQLEVDKKYVFFSKDFLPRQEHAGKKMKHYPEVFTQQSVLHFKPMLLVRFELVTHGFQNINYDCYMCDIMLNQPALLQQWKHKIQGLKQKREEQHAPMRDKVNKENKEIERRMTEPGFVHYLIAIETMSGFDKDGDIVCVSSRRKQYAWNSIDQLFVKCSKLAQKMALTNSPSTPTGRLQSTGYIRLMKSITATANLGACLRSWQTILLFLHNGLQLRCAQCFWCTTLTRCKNSGARICCIS